MKIVFIGDVYGPPGIKILEEKINEIKQTYKPNVIILNGENIHHGRGINLKIYKQLMNLGVDVVTLGNWGFGNHELLDFIDGSNIIRPANYLNAPGAGYKVVNFNNQKLLVINLMGRVFMNPNLENPFLIAEKILKEVPHDYSIIDFHAEATSEKVALGHYLDGLVSAVVGTHTHVQTSDNRVLPKNTLYITDVGMTGSLNEIIGVSKEIVIERFLTGYAKPNKTVKGDMQLNAVYLNLDNKEIKRIYMELKENE